MNDILLIHLPLSGMIQTPVGLFSIGSWLESHGAKVRIVDMRLYSPMVATTLVHTEIQRSRFVGVSFMTCQTPAFLELVELFGGLLKGKLIAGGIHPTLYPGQVEPYADYVCHQPGEDFVAGVLGAHVSTPYDPTTAPPRNWDLIDTDLYMQLGHTIHGAIRGPGHICIDTSRGCNAKCAFCINNVLPWGHPWKPRGTSAVLMEISKLCARGARTFTFFDEYFFTDIQRVVEICEHITKSRSSQYKPRPWGAAARVRDITRNRELIIDLAKNHGFTSTNIGIESGSPEVLKRIRKPHTPGEAIACAAILQNAGVRGIYSFMSGFPGETPEQAEATLRLMREMGRVHPNSRTTPPGNRTQPYRPLPGTELAKEDDREWPRSLPEWAYWIEHSPDAAALIMA